MSQSVIGAVAVADRPGYWRDLIGINDVWIQNCSAPAILVKAEPSCLDSTLIFVVTGPEMEE